MAKYDVFISYSRKDMAVSDKICAAFDAADISYFIDRQGIGGGMEFPEVLARNIIDSEKFLFLASKNSYESKFTNSEITFAFNKKSKESILPYLIDDTPLPLGLEFVFCNINQRNIKEHPIETVLVADLLNMLGRTAKQEVAKPQPTLSVAKTYRVGDYYYDGKKQGVVFEVSADGRHGKIVSLTESTEMFVWCTKEMEDVYVGASDIENGANNMAAVKRIEGWRNKYRAFAWCDQLGEGWYLPAIEELKKFTLHKEINAKVNETLKSRGCQPIGSHEPNKNGWYWSSSESEDVKFCAWYVGMDDGDASNLSKGSSSYVRAVSVF